MRRPPWRRWWRHAWNLFHGSLFWHVSCRYGAPPLFLRPRATIGNLRVHHLLPPPLMTSYSEKFLRPRVPLGIRKYTSPSRWDLVKKYEEIMKEYEEICENMNKYVESIQEYDIEIREYTPSPLPLMTSHSGKFLISRGIIGNPRIHLSSRPRRWDGEEIWGKRQRRGSGIQRRVWNVLGALITSPWRHRLSTLLTSKSHRRPSNKKMFHFSLHLNLIF